MHDQRPDIPERVDSSPRAQGAGLGSGSAGGQRRPLTAAEFGARFEAASRALWCIAVGVTGDRVRADDLVQEAAMIALTKLHEFDPESSFLAWMGQIVRYLALNERRRAARERGMSQDHAFEKATRPSPPMRKTGTFPVTSDGTLTPDQKMFDDTLAAAVATLDETPRSCLLLKVVSGLSYREISRALSIPEGTAMSHVHRARQSLRKHLTGSPLDPS
ncbi:MAG: RNA polymerase sigma factor [Planctomycetota bacterium]|nr:RNA polymerase sigma factor [Planctomycetota bacterium]